ncbi:carboxypeptidase-like regulatory domain-containing protein [uncultured Paludibaculum sp.]|uniref:carboxypeptidase-like regulatory domain-containing protein n=1 Tax=uncultured Paludibaculum sp. TaxID=1765020 RepID=UPI002AAAAC21|nr:carboxypeptidase-like regulatory domain-containing protein [uncultured Paludibaculum sp.]
MKFIQYIVVGSAIMPLGAMAVTGEIVDPQNRGVPSARIRLKCDERTFGTRSGVLGQFHLSFGGPAGNCMIQVSHHGFEPFSGLVSADNRKLTIRLNLAVVRTSLRVDSSEQAAASPPDGAFASSVLTDNEFEQVSRSTESLVRYVKLQAGAIVGADALYVDGLPSSELPSTDMISRIEVNSDPFSAEYSDGDSNRIEITTKTPNRKFRFSLGGDPPGLGGRSPLAAGLRRVAKSYNGRLVGFVPRLPVSFSAQASIGRMLDKVPVVANLLAARRQDASGERPFTTVDQRSVNGRLDVQLSPGQHLRSRVTYSGSGTIGFNAGTGGLVLQEAGFRSSQDSHQLRATFDYAGARLLHSGGVVVTQTRSAAFANSEAAAISVLGEFVSGGSSLAESHSSRNNWTWKHLVRPADGGGWVAGFTVSRYGERNRERSNPAGVYQFSDVAAYLAALDGAPTGTLFGTQGNGAFLYHELTASSFVQKDLARSSRYRVTGGFRADYQPGFGAIVSPRISGVREWQGLILRAGLGLFARGAPRHMLTWALRNDGEHLRPFILRNVALGVDASKLEHAEETVRSQMDPHLSQTRELMAKMSIERPMKAFLPGLEYTWSASEHLWGVRRLPTGLGWVDLVEANRSAERHRLHAKLVLKMKVLSIASHYQWIHSTDDGSGPNSFPVVQNSLRGEWARSAGLAAHNVTMAGSIQLPARTFLTLAESWHGSVPYNVTTGLDSYGNGLFNDRGGRPRNSGNGPGSNFLSAYAVKRLALPRGLTGEHARKHLSVGAQIDNLLNNRNYAAVGSIAGSATFGKPILAQAGRSIKFSLNLD